MRKWIAIRVSALLAVLGSGATLLFAGILAWTAFFVEPPETLAESPMRFKVLMLSVAAFFAALGIWGLATAAGLFRRSEWARLSIMIFSLLLVGMGGSALAGTLFIHMPQNGRLPPEVLSRIRLGMAGFYGSLTTLGIWWLLLFNSRRSKQYFVELAVRSERGRPLSIGIIGWYLLISTLVTAVAAILRIPGMFFGFLLTGWAALAVYTAFTAVQLYLGTGLLQLQEPARVGSILYFLIVAANAAVTVALPDFPGRMRLMQEALPRFLHFNRETLVPLEGSWGVTLVAAAYAVIPVWFLVRRRGSFVRT
jgi:hypothetical protein